MNAPRNRAGLGLGTATFMPGYGIGGSADSAATHILQTAIASGIRYVDTAAAYGDSELTLGRHAGLLKANRIRVCTKIPASAAMPEAASDSVRAACARVGLCPFDTVLLHSAGLTEVTDQHTSDALHAIKSAGLALRIGASTYGEEAARAAVTQSWCDTIQIEYSILNQSVLRAVQLASPACEVVVRSVLCKGLLSARRHEAGRLAAEIGQELEQLDALAREWSYELPELAIRFALDSAPIDVVLVGVSTAEELSLALRAFGRDALSDEQLAVLRAFDRSHLDCVHPERWVLT